MSSNIQLEMSFGDSPNKFRTKMEQGVFTVLFEVPSPVRNETISASSAHLKSLEDAIINVTKIETGLAITDKIRAKETWNPADFANILDNSQKNKHIIFISGKGLKLSAMPEVIERCKSSGFQNLVPVTGDLLTNEDKRNSPCYTDSIYTLNMISERNDSGFFYPGCVVNPFKYTPSSIYPQYYKLIKKLKKGASFIISQAGWDMVKLQELRWYLEMREMHYPLIFRMLLLTPEMAEDIMSGKKPGYYMSCDLANILKKESKYGITQFASAQWRRLQIQAAGAKLMGCSAVMISGVELPEHARIVCQRISEALDEFKTFDDWKLAYLNYLARADMAPYPNRFYVFENLFTRQNPELKNMAAGPPAKCSDMEKKKFRISKKLFRNANLRFAGEQLLAKKILTKCPGCSYCRLPLTHYICPETCPKGLANGPCGGTQTDALCENKKNECIHSKQFRIASWKKSLDTIEERFIRSI